MADKEQKLNDFLKLCLQRAKSDNKYAVLDHQDGVFLNEYVEFSFQTFKYLSDEKITSRLRESFHHWRELNYGESKKAGAFFAYVEALSSDHVSHIINRWFDLSRKSHNLQREVMYRAFILAGMCSQQDPVKDDE